MPDPAFAQSSAGGPPRLVSVIVPVRNEQEHFAEQLEALAAQDYDGAWELVVADNGSTDGTRDLTTARVSAFPAARLVDAGERRGPAYARNAGAKAAAGDFLAFCDADDVVATGWLRGLVEGGRTSHLVAGRKDVDRLNGTVNRSWYDAPPDGPAVGLQFLPFAGGGNCGIWREVFDELGGFDEDWVTGQDIELSWRAQVRGYSLGFAPDAIIHQRFRRQVSRLARQHFLWGKANARLFRDFRDAGMPRSRVRNALLVWGWILVTVPGVVWSPRARGRWTRLAALRAGRLAESIAQRVMYL